MHVLWSVNGAHIGYNCPPKVPIISNSEQCNQTIAELPQTLPIVHPTCNYEDENSFIYDSKLNSSNDSPSVLTHPPQLQFETYLCELCGNNAHYGYDCPPQFPLVYEQEPFSLPRDIVRNFSKLKKELNVRIYKAFLKEYDHIPLNEKCMALLLAEERFLKIKQVMREEQNQPKVIQELLLKLMDDLQSLKGNQQEKTETAAQNLIPYWNSFMIDDEDARDNFLNLGEIKDALMDKQYQQEDIQELMSKLLEDVRNISKEFSEYINCPSWYRLLFYLDDDDDDVEDLDPIPSGSKGVSDDICDNDHSDAKSLLSQDVPITSPKIDFLSEEFTGEFTPTPPGMDEDEFDEEEVDCYDHDFSSDDDSFEDIKYVEASPLNLEYDRLEEENEDHKEKEFDLEDIFQIQDVILREKLLNVHRLITNIKFLKNNPTPDFVLKSPSSIPISITDSDSFFEESDTSLSHSDNSLPEFKTFSDHTEETRSGMLLFDLLLEFPEFESFHFDPSFPRPPPEPPDVENSLVIETDAPVINNVDELNEDECFDPGGGENNVEVDDSFTFVTWTFLPFLTYPEVSPLLSSTKNEDTIFDPGIST
ncbi:hypothetical protein Tco_1429306 [Tanacetum coccineum]